MLDAISQLSKACQELKGQGITIKKLPGEYQINFCGGGDGTARFTESLEEAIREGHSMAKQVTAKNVTPHRDAVMPLTFKAKRRCKILAHNHKARAIWLKRRRKSHK